MVRLELSERQADAVLAMPLRRKPALNRKACARNWTTFVERERLTLLLENRDQLLDALVSELEAEKAFAAAAPA